MFSVFLGLAGFRSRATYCEPPASHTLSHESNFCEGALVLDVKLTPGYVHTYVRAKATGWRNKVDNRFPRYFLRCTPVVRCAYFVSAAAVADVAAKAAALGNNLPGNDDTKNGTTLADDNDGGDGGDVHHSAGTLCLLDNPLTSLDAETREHVLQHCIHGVMRRGNPGVAVVVTCGECDPAEKEQRETRWNIFFSPVVQPPPPLNGVLKVWFQITGNVVDFFLCFTFRPFFVSDSHEGAGRDGAASAAVSVYQAVLRPRRSVGGERGRRHEARDGGGR